MEYKCEIEIDLPVEKVVELFDNQDNLQKWMEGLKKIEHISGTPGMPDAQTKLYFDMGKRKVEMIETIKTNNLPEEFTAKYEASGVVNIAKNSFEAVAGDKTKYVTHQEFQFKGMMKLMGLLMPGAFKKQTQKYLERFKEFAEKEASENNE